MNRVPSSSFTYIKRSRTFACEMSDLGKEFRFSPVYPDAADEGFIMVSSKTHKEVVFSLFDKLWDVGGEELLAWELRPTPESVRQVPSAAGLRVTIYND